jgi:hypothetical protein
MGIVHKIVLVGIFGLSLTAQGADIVVDITTKAEKTRTPADEIRAQIREQVATIRHLKRSELNDSLKNASDKAKEQARKVADEVREAARRGRGRPE